MSQKRVMKKAGAWCIVFGTVSIVMGVALGVGCLVAGGKLLSGASGNLIAPEDM